MNFDTRPAPGDCAPYYFRYLDLVPKGDILETLERAIVDTLALLRTVPSHREGYRYAEGKWTIKEVVGHLVDTERIFATRALWFLRRDAQPLPGMEQDDWVAAGNFDVRSLANLAGEFEALRRANLLLFRDLDDELLARAGIASGATFTVRSILFLLAGHEMHHVGVLRERYL